MRSISHIRTLARARCLLAVACLLSLVLEASAQEPRFPQLKLEDTSGDQRVLAERMLKETRVGLGGPWNVLLRSPGMAEGMLSLYNHFRRKTALPQRLVELGILITAREWSVPYEWSVHYLLMDRDAKFSEAFRIILDRAGVEALRLPARSPNLNPNLERFMRSVKEECLERMIFFRESSLQVAVAEFLSHFHAERNHQGIGNRLIEPGEEVGLTAGDVACRERLGGMLRYYHRKAA